MSMQSLIKNSLVFPNKFYEGAYHCLRNDPEVFKFPGGQACYNPTAVRKLLVEFIVV